MHWSEDQTGRGGVNLALTQTNLFYDWLGFFNGVNAPLLLLCGTALCTCSVVFPLPD